jgi:plasmid stability protein
MEEEVRRILRAALAVPSPAEEGRKKLEELVAKEMEYRRRRGQ